MKPLNILLIYCLWGTPLSAQIIASVSPWEQGHSHNDYYRETPLFDALSLGFKSVEADVYLVDDVILVGHDPHELSLDRSLSALYLEPLKKIINGNEGRVYNSTSTFLLLIDFKEPADKLYPSLMQLLRKYKSLFCRFENGQYIEGPVQVLLSGESSEKQLREDPNRLAFLDGRIPQLKLGIETELAPLISANWNDYFDWKGGGEMPEQEARQLQRLATQCEEEGKRLRFWATPSQGQEAKKNCWQHLVRYPAILIGADDLAMLRNTL